MFSDLGLKPCFFHRRSVKRSLLCWTWRTTHWPSKGTTSSWVLPSGDSPKPASTPPSQPSTVTQRWQWFTRGTPPMVDACVGPSLCKGVPSSVRMDGEGSRGPRPPLQLLSPRFPAKVQINIHTRPVTLHASDRVCLWRHSVASQACPCSGLLKRCCSDVECSTLWVDVLVSDVHRITCLVGRFSRNLLLFFVFKTKSCDFCATSRCHYV